MHQAHSIVFERGRRGQTRPKNLDTQKTITANHDNPNPMRIPIMSILLLISLYSLAVFTSSGKKRGWGQLLDNLIFICKFSKIFCWEEKWVPPPLSPFTTTYYCVCIEIKTFLNIAPWLKWACARRFQTSQDFSTTTSSSNVCLISRYFMFTDNSVRVWRRLCVFAI